MSLNTSGVLPYEGDLIADLTLLFNEIYKKVNQIKSN